MRSCGSLSNTRARKIDDVGAVGLIVNSNGSVGFAFIRAKYLGTLQVGTTSIEFFSAFEVNENLLHNSGVTNTLSTSKLEFVSARAIAPNTTL